MQVCSAAAQGNVACREIPQPGNPQGSTEEGPGAGNSYESGLLSWMWEVRSSGGQSLFPKQAALVSPVARAGRQVMVCLLAWQGVQGG